MDWLLSGIWQLSDCKKISRSTTSYLAVKCQGMWMLRPVSQSLPVLSPYIMYTTLPDIEVHVISHLP